TGQVDAAFHPQACGEARVGRAVEDPPAPLETPGRHGRAVVRDGVRFETPSNDAAGEGSPGLVRPAAVSSLTPSDAPPRSAHEPAAVDVDRLPGDVAVARQQDHDVGDLLGRAEAADGDQVRPGPGVGGDHLRLDQRRGDAVDRDALFAESVPTRTTAHPTPRGMSAW